MVRHVKEILFLLSKAPTRGGVKKKEQAGVVQEKIQNKTEATPRH